MATATETITLDVPAWVVDLAPSGYEDLEPLLAAIEDAANTPRHHTRLRGEASDRVVSELIGTAEILGGLDEHHAHLIIDWAQDMVGYDINVNADQLPRW